MSPDWPLIGCPQRPVVLLGEPTVGLQNRNSSTSCHLSLPLRATQQEEALGRPEWGQLGGWEASHLDPGPSEALPLAVGRWIPLEHPRLQPFEDCSWPILLLLQRPVGIISTCTDNPAL